MGCEKKYVGKSMRFCRQFVMAEEESDLKVYYFTQEHHSHPLITLDHEDFKRETYECVNTKYYSIESLIRMSKMPQNNAS